MEKNNKIIAWFSAGITSAIACKLAIEKYGKNNVELAYIEINTSHQDNERFIKECENWYGQKIYRFKSDKFNNQHEIARHRKYINGPAGASCTMILKKEVRYKIEEQINFTGQIFGFEYSKGEINRAIRFSQQYPVSKPLYPLIEKKLTKSMCADILLKNGIKLPTMYELGFHNNNCIGCVKGGKGYWNHIRKHFPNHFKKMVETENIVKRSCIKGTFLKDLNPKAGIHKPPITPDCGTFCEIEFADIIDKRTDEVLTGLKSMQQLKLF